MSLGGAYFEVSRLSPFPVFSHLLLMDPDVNPQLFLLPCLYSTIMDSNPLKLSFFFSKLLWSWCFITVAGN